MGTYLVTGGAGFIGSNFIKYTLNKYQKAKIICLDKLTYAGNKDNIKRELESKGDNFKFIRGDINNRELLEYIFTEWDITWIVNFAAETHVDRSIKSTGPFLKANIMGVQQLLEAAKNSWQTGENQYHTGVKFLQISTDEVYGSLKGNGYFSENNNLKPNNTYSATKASADLLLRAYYKTHNFPIIITRSSNNYGPRQLPEKLIPLMIKNTIQGDKLPVYGNGLNIRDWLHVKDHCRALDMVIKKGNPGKIYNIGAHDERTNIAIVKMIIRTVKEFVQNNEKYRRILQTDLENINDSLITLVKDRKGHDRRYALDPSKIKDELGWEAEIELKEGLPETVKWYLDNPKFMLRKHKNS